MLTQIAIISSKSARDIVAASIEEAERMKLIVAVCVTDPSGHNLASARMDGVAPPTLTFAEDKAYTSATMKRSTEAFAERMASSPSLTMGLSTRSRLLVWAADCQFSMRAKLSAALVCRVQKILKISQSANMRCSASVFRGKRKRLFYADTSRMIVSMLNFNRSSSAFFAIRSRSYMTDPVKRFVR